ncbi:MAG: MotE family protein, partial [Nitrospinaceae bacterium]
MKLARVLLAALVLPGALAVALLAGWPADSGAQLANRLEKAKAKGPPVFDDETTGTPSIQDKKPELPPPPPALNPDTLRMMEMIEQRSRELREREEEMALKEKNLEALEAKVLGDLKKVERALVRSEAQVGIKRDLIEKNVANLVKVYSAMKPEESARLLETLDQDIAIQILSRMKSKTAGKVLGKMSTRVAKTISEKIAGKRV